jgi:hypothetical protein
MERPLGYEITRNKYDIEPFIKKNKINFSVYPLKWDIKRIICHSLWFPI